MSHLMIICMLTTIRVLYEPLIFVKYTVHKFGLDFESDRKTLCHVKFRRDSAAI